MEPPRAEPEISPGAVTSRSTRRSLRAAVDRSDGVGLGCVLGRVGWPRAPLPPAVDRRPQAGFFSGTGSYVDDICVGRAQLTPIVVDSPQQASAPEPGASVPESTASLVPFTDIASSVTSVLAPPLSSVGYALSTGNLHTTVYLTTAAFQSVASTEGQVLVSALIRGATPGTNYRLVGGGCEDTATDTVWAQGVADSAGVAYLSGDSRTLNAGVQYFLTLDPAPLAKLAALSGLEGVFALGQAVPFVGHVTRDQGVTGGQCAIGP